MPALFVLHKRWFNEGNVRNTHPTYSRNDNRQHETMRPLLVIENLTNERILYNLPHSGDCFAQVNLLKDSWDDSQNFHVTVFIPKVVDGNIFTYCATDWVT